MGLDERQGEIKYHDGGGQTGATRETRNRSPFTPAHSPIIVRRPVTAVCMPTL
jgi:hypothetical protein